MWLVGGLACTIGLYASWRFFKEPFKQTRPSTNLAALWQAKLPDQVGRMQSLAQYRGRPLVVNFWAAWCEPCVEEMPVLSALQKKYAAKGVHFIGIAVDSATNVAQFMQKVKVDYALYSAGYGGLALARALGNTQGGLPFTVLIDASGKIHSTLLGSVTRDEKRLNALSEQLDAL